MTQQEIEDKIVRDIVEEAMRTGECYYNMKTLEPVYIDENNIEVISATLQDIENRIEALGCTIEDVSANDMLDEFGSQYVARYDAEQVSRDKIESALTKANMNWSDLLTALKSPSTFWALRHADKNPSDFYDLNVEGDEGVFNLYHLINQLKDESETTPTNER